MDNFFKMDALSDWHAVAPGEALEFYARGARRVRIYFMCNASVEVWASPSAKPQQEVLVGFGSGQFSCEFTTDGDTMLRILAPEDAAIFARGAAPDHRVAAADLPVYTDIAPRSRRNTEYDRMMMLMRWNEEQRQARHAAEMAKLQALVQNAASTAATVADATQGATPPQDAQQGGSEESAA